MSIVAAGIAPHPPIIIPEVGGRELVRVDKTVNALRQLSRQIAAAGPETIVLITPHGPLRRDSSVFLTAERLKGDFRTFRAPSVRLEAENDLELVRLMEKSCAAESFKTLLLHKEESLDHGVTVPLYYLQEAGTARCIVAMTFPLLPYKELYRLGKVIALAAAASGRRLAVVASGDLSHRLIRGAPGGYHPRGVEFDRRLVEDLKHNRVEKILSIDEELVDGAGECGLRSIVLLLGSLSLMTYGPEILSYEGPFGVGYLVAFFHLEGEGE